jgi:hypothetical protein
VNLVDKYYYTGSSRQIPVILYGPIIDDKAMGTDATTGYSVKHGSVIHLGGAETVAHELGHVLMQDPSHYPNPWNLMNKDHDNWPDLDLEQWQIDQARRTIVREAGWQQLD